MHLFLIIINIMIIYIYIYMYQIQFTCKGVNFLNGLAAAEQKQEPCRVRVQGLLGFSRD